MVHQIGNTRYGEGRLVFCAIVGGLIVWMIRHPYAGIWHDGIIYALMGARWIEPSAYLRDPFFMFGSQDEFSIFSPIYGFAIQTMGLADSARAVVMLGGLLWVVALSMLVRAATIPSLAYLSAVLVGSWVTSSYSPNAATFSVTENFATARIIAQPLALIAIALAVSSRMRAGLAVSILSTLIHPLMGGWSLLILLTKCLSERLILFFLFTAIAFCLYAFYFVPVWLHVLSFQELAQLRTGTRDVLIGFPGEFRLGDYSLWVGLLMLGARCGSERLSWLYLSTALVAVWGVFGSMVTSYYFPVEIILKLQPWRAMWIAIPIAVLALFDVMGRISRTHSALWCVIGMLAVMLYLLGTSICWLLILFLLLPEKLAERIVCSVELLLIKNSSVAMLLFLGLILIALPGYLVDMDIEGHATAYSMFLPEYPVLRGVFIAGGYGLTLLGFAMLLNVIRRSWLSLPILMLVLALVIWQWDHRQAGAIAVEKQYLAQKKENIFSEIKRGDVVFWPGNEMGVWFQLGTANYATPFQAVGRVFSPEKFREVERRIKHVHSVICEKSRGLECLTPKTFGRSGLKDLCSDVELDWVILRDDLGIPVASQFSKRQSVDERDYRLYKCELVNGGLF